MYPFDESEMLAGLKTLIMAQIQVSLPHQGRRDQSLLHHYRSVLSVLCQLQ
jgi:hypothetical protein